MALNRTAAQSGVLWWGSVAALAVDGDVELGDVNTCARTATVWQPWWAVDLGAPMLVSDVLLLPRGDCCGGARARV